MTPTQSAAALVVLVAVSVTIVGPAEAWLPGRHAMRRSVGGHIRSRNLVVVAAVDDGAADGAVVRAAPAEVALAEVEPAEVSPAEAKSADAEVGPAEEEPAQEEPAQEEPAQEEPAVEESVEAEQAEDEPANAGDPSKGGDLMRLVAPTQPGSPLVRRNTIDAVAGALTRTLDRSDRANGLLLDELVALRGAVAAELQVEEGWAADLEALLARVDDVVTDKTVLVERETALLADIQALEAQTTEAVIKRRLRAAASAKAELMAIELMLCETCSDCSQTLTTELELLRGRVATMRAAEAAMPRVDDPAAVRAYGFDEIVALQQTIVQSEEATAKRTAEVNSLKARIASAMKQRNQMLGLPAAVSIDELSAPAPAPAPAPKPAAAEATAPSPSPIPAASKDDTDAVVEGSFAAGQAITAAATASAFAVLGVAGKLSRMTNATSRTWSTEAAAELETAEGVGQKVAAIFNGVKSVVQSEQVRESLADSASDKSAKEAAGVAKESFNKARSAFSKAAANRKSK